MRHASGKPGQRGPRIEPFDERTFRYLLTLEQRRSDRSGRPFLLVLVDTGTARKERTRIPPEAAASIFDGLSQHLRETDFVGWYEDGLCAGAVLTELGEVSRTDMRKLLDNKALTRGLVDRLPPDVASRLHVEASRYPTSDEVLDKPKRLLRGDR
jgi:hypothetical protein